MRITRTHFVFAPVLLLAAAAMANPMELKLREQQETAAGSGRYHLLVRKEQWNPEQTAIVVCDVWDLHHSLNAVRRVEEFGPRLNEVLKRARAQGVTIIHSPSDCMEAYQDHPARARAQQAPRAANLPDDVESWCSRIPEEEKVVYPLDQSDGGDDDDPVEHAAWAKKLEALGRNPGIPWKRQSKLIEIDERLDFVSDKGDEVWNVLEQRGIKNVILAGVHTNMCVLGRPFGLRQMARNGKNVVLMRDMTDTMYNPARWPYVSHFTGNDLIIAHVERFVCPTITSDQILGGKPFQFSKDKRPHLVVVMAEDEYETNVTLPRFAADYLGKSFRVSYVFGNATERNDIPGLQVLNDADVALLSIRRRVLPPDQMKIVRKFIQRGKPVVGIRTASHAFSLRKEEPPKSLRAWPEFDAQVFGGNYHNHHGNALKSTVTWDRAAKDHPILAGVDLRKFVQGGSLYKTSPLAEKTHVLAWGAVDGFDREPVAWTFQRRDGGRSFYTSMGHVNDFDNPAFLRMFVNGLHWAAQLAPPTSISIGAPGDYRDHWTHLAVPGAWEAAPALKDFDGVGWYRCVVRTRDRWLKGKGFQVQFAGIQDNLQVWFNGHAVNLEGGVGAIDRKWIELNDANLLVVRVVNKRGSGGLTTAPVVSASGGEMTLKGNWQFRLGDDERWRMIPLPARYGGSPDVLFEPQVASKR